MTTGTRHSVTFHTAEAKFVARQLIRCGTTTATCTCGWSYSHAAVNFITPMVLAHLEATR